MYHLPIGEAATILGVGITVLKKFCRKENVPRWPYSLILKICPKHRGKFLYLYNIVYHFFSQEAYES